jgi:hypothetical protein
MQSKQKYSTGGGKTDPTALQFSLPGQLTWLRKGPKGWQSGRAPGSPRHMGRMHLAEGNRSGYMCNSEQLTRGLFLITTLFNSLPQGGTQAF